MSVFELTKPFEIEDIILESAKQDSWYPREDFICMLEIEKRYPLDNGLEIAKCMFGHLHFMQSFPVRQMGNITMNIMLYSKEIERPI